jgi:hypothetical protein
MINIPENLPIERTKRWIQEVVIGLNFCPFAAKPFKSDSIHYLLLDDVQVKDVLENLVNECLNLRDNSNWETSLIVLSDCFGEFEDYLDLVDLCEQLIEKEGFEGEFQVASFHPNYLFAGSDETDPANYTNRSPFPKLHILREEELEKAIDKHVDIDSIPEENIKKANDLGIEFFKNLNTSL